MDYLAPEYILSGHCDTASDMFSVGVLFHAIYNHGRPVFECRNELAVFRRHVADVSVVFVALLLSGLCVSEHTLFYSFSYTLDELLN